MDARFIAPAPQLRSLTILVTVYAPLVQCADSFTLLGEFGKIFSLSPKSMLRHVGKVAELFLGPCSFLDVLVTLRYLKQITLRVRRSPVLKGLQGEFLPYFLS